LFINHFLYSAHMRQEGVCDNAKLCLRHGAQRIIPQSAEYYNLMVKARRALIRLKLAQQIKNFGFTMKCLRFSRHAYRRLKMHLPQARLSRRW
jgi:hypothetical protein